MLFPTLHQNQGWVADAKIGTLSQWFRKGRRRGFMNEISPDGECEML